MVTCVTISLNLSSPEGEGFQPSPIGTLTLFGCARSEHLAYEAWNSRNLAHITNNQAGNILLNATNAGIEVYIENVNYAQIYNGFDYTKTLYGCFYLNLARDFAKI